MAKLLTASEIGEVRALQGEVRAYQTLLDYQDKPSINLNQN